jgi:ribosomal protein S18 acetylase RimI-like enzyme
MLHQILNSAPFNGAAKRVFNNFLEMVQADVYLSVRQDNTIARKFYERNGMYRVGSVSWSKGSIPGVIYLIRWAV